MCQFYHRYFLGKHFLVTSSFSVLVGSLIHIIFPYKVLKMKWSQWPFKNSLLRSGLLQKLLIVMINGQTISELSIWEMLSIFLSKKLIMIIIFEVINVMYLFWNFWPICNLYFSRVNSNCSRFSAYISKSFECVTEQYYWSLKKEKEEKKVGAEKCLWET